jgi:leader peptidase (prepilin peptidase) / N-methyltransferase
VTLADLPFQTQWLLAAWLFATGGAVGSFLNVVVYRLPAGMSLVRPGSHCPACRHPIRWFDNVPIFAWIALGGRCRDCKAAISPRYPLVEGVTAVAFLTLGVVECLLGGVNLPLREVPAGEFARHLQRPPEELCALCAFHLLLLCTLFSAALIDCDRHRAPARLFVPALVVGLTAPLAYPLLHPVPAWNAQEGLAAAVIDNTTGLAAGLLLGCLIGTLWKNTAMLLGTACVGLYLGWQAVGVVVPATIAVYVLHSALARRAGRPRPPAVTPWLALATLAWILTWARLY